MNKLDLDYQNLLQDILDNGIKKEDRTGTGTLSVFGRIIRHDMKTGFPAVTTKRLYFKGIVTELLWFLRGDTNIKYLVDNGCNIWNGDSYQNYLKETVDLNPLSQEEFIDKIKNDEEFSDRFGDLGPIYGKQWRSWENYQYEYGNIVGDNSIDQIQNIINDLKTNPDSRRLMVSAWNPAHLKYQVLPPCHYGFQVYTRDFSLDERLDLMRKRTRDGTVDYDNRHHVFLDFHNIPKRAISLMFNMRSTDVPLGFPFNIASYGLLLEIIGKMVNMVPDELIANLGDAHIYKNQINGAGEQLTREPYKLPTLSILDDVNFTGSIDDMLISCTRDSFKLDGYESHSSIKMPLSN